VGKPEGRRPLGRPRRRWISRKWDVGIWTGLGWPSIETGGVLFFLFLSETYGLGGGWGVWGFSGETGEKETTGET
jgi:hypothetical protein